MENAAQALLIAGGILLAILILSSVVIMSNNISIFGSAQAEKQEAERLIAWNAEWEAYNKQLLYGVDVLTVINKANQNNSEYDDEEYKVKITVEGTDKNGIDITVGNIAKYKKSVFKCTNMLYSPETGRINSIKFELIEDLN